MTYRFALLTMILTAGCLDSGLGGPSAGTGDAQLAVLNALGTDDRVRFAIDGNDVAMPSAGTTISVAIAAGTHRLEVRALTSQTILASADFAVPGGGRRSAVVSGGTTPGIALLVASDTASLPPAAAAKVRVVHAVSGGPTFDSYLSLVGQPVDIGARFVSPFAYGVGQAPEFPGYAVRGPGTYQVTLKAPGSAAPAVLSDPFQMGAGQVFSVVLAKGVDGVLVLRVVRER
ncbi:MAG: DUF4397 domain-containing protein [Gemmatimonadales bacterium]|nr:DUF4397 domain-containing protein [Gemmatimonadales bacterium]